MKKKITDLQKNCKHNFTNHPNSTQKNHHYSINFTKIFKFRMFGFK